MKMHILILVFIMLIGGCATYNYNLSRRQEYVNSHSGLPQDIKQCILEGSIRIGMTKDEVESSWGRPQNKQTMVSSWGVTETWITYNNSILTFFNGKLQNINGEGIKEVK